MAQLKFFALLALAELGVLLVRAQNSSCRCLSTDSCWPPYDEFAALQANLSQPFITPTPLAAVCYPPGAPSGNCTAVQQGWTDPTFSTDHPGQMEERNWEAFIFPNGTIEECPMNNTLGIPCGQGNVPILGADVRTPEDIQAAVAFAVEHNLRVVVKNTG